MTCTEKKTLSVVIPTYNMEKYIRRCLDSLTYDRKMLDRLEIIVVNDGGTDGSLKIANDYERQYSGSIVVIDKKNGGHGSTINAGIEKARGKYFMVVDADDWVNIDDFRKLVQYLTDHDEDLVITNYSREEIWMSSTTLISYNNVPYNEVFRAENFDFSKLGGHYFHMANSIYRTAMLRDSGFRVDEGCFYVDMEYIVFPIMLVCTFVYLDLDIYRYYIGRPTQSVSSAGMRRNRKDHAKVLKKILDFYSSIGHSDNRRAYVERIATLMTRTHYEIYLWGASERSFRKEIVGFDKYLKKVAPDIYSNVKGSHINLNRNTRFLFAASEYNYLSLLARIERR